MTGKVKSLSIVVPVFNAAPALIALQAEIDKVMVQLAIPYKLILVDDGSEDKSWEVMKAVRNNNPDKVIAIRMSKNYGQHNAIFVGFRSAKGDYIITMDDDLQHPPDEIPKLLNCALETDADLVYGISKVYKRSYLRKFLRWGYRLLNRMTADDKEGSAFRVIKKDLVNKLITHDQEFVFIDELAHWYTEKIEY
ncbi:MAG TPA: glycosyltransferase family 2 protein, partial [Bacteroidia bacterium]|nr:glycosyltransferase family 2 protein [Bacteroidia bacterium]